MACKMSSWEEEELLRDSSMEYYGMKFNSWKWEILDTIECINSFLIESKRAFPEELKPWQEVAQNYMPDPDAIKWNEMPKYNNEQLSSGIAHDQQKRTHDWYIQLAKNLEIALCNLRTWLLQNYLTYEEKLPDAFILQVERERNLHVMHRMNELRDQIELLKGVITKCNSEVHLLEIGINNMKEKNESNLDSHVQKSRASIEKMRTQISEAMQKIKSLESIPKYLWVIER